LAGAIATAAGGPRWRRRVLPGFGLTLGFTLTYLSLVVLLPLAVLFAQAAGVGWAKVWAELSNARTLAAFRVSFGIAFLAALVNAVFGLVIAWVLVRYRFPGRRFVDALIDLPFGLPTAVAGISLTSLYASTGWIGAPLAAIDVKIAFTQAGILVALVFVGLPFVVRTVEPVLRDLEREAEEAAAMLGANRAHILARVILPPLVPALLTGFTLAFARAIGEYGSVIFIAGNMPGRTEILPLLIVIKLEQFDYAGATLIAALMLVASFALLFAMNLLQGWTGRWQRG
jgi:sulfate transport system permease protein